MRLSKVGQKMNRLTGVREIMKDIATALKSDPNTHWINLSPGNPLVLPEVDEMWRTYAQEIVNSEEFSEVIGRYGMTQGYEPFVDAIVEVYNKNYNWGIKRENVLITAGSQSLYFLAANTFCGKMRSGEDLRILIPRCPEYTGYDGVVLEEDSIIGKKPSIEILPGNRFKYGIDFDNINVDESIGAILCSRPSNPTGNMLTDQEMERLSDLAEQFQIPLMVDSAYAAPFPNLCYTEMNPIFNENVIHCVSLSKAGLPGERIGIAIGAEKYIQCIEPFYSNAGIHSSRFGQALALRAFRSGKLQGLSESVIKPTYFKKLQLFQELMDQQMPDINWNLHKAEGSLFAWVWIDEEWMDDYKLYEALKKERLLLVPGSTFFPGLKEEWDHKHQCIRISLTASDEDITKAASILAKVLHSGAIRQKSAI